MKNLLTIKDVLKYVETEGRHWTRSYIYQLMGSKRLDSIKIGYSRMFRKSHVDKVLKNMKKRSPSYPMSSLRKAF